MLIVIDNYDSFTYNLVQYLTQLGQEVRVYLNDQLAVEEIASLKPSHIVISPGPGSPAEAGISVATIERWGGRIPILGVCLGHQSIGHAYGGRVVPAQTLMHGKVSRIHHTGRGVFQHLPASFEATRYHSLAIDRHSLPECLEVTAWADDGEIMGVRHKVFGIEGVQFHPEAILTQHGHQLLENFLHPAPGLP
jgi:anthranilate synthase component 2